MKQLEHPACLVAAVKKPAAHAVHNDTPPTEYVPASQSEQALSADAVPCDEMCVPAAQYVFVMHDDAPAAALYDPEAQPAHDDAPPIENIPATQDSHELFCAYFPGPQ